MAGFNKPEPRPTPEGDNNMSKFINLSEDIAIATENTRSPYAWDAQREALEWLDSHPDQVPGRTITESELREYVEEIWDYVDHEGVKELAGWCGANVIPDPKPTNTESIGYLIDAYRSISFPTMALSDYLDKAGVKAPTDD